MADTLVTPPRSNGPRTSPIPTWDSTIIKNPSEKRNPGLMACIFTDITDSTNLWEQDEDTMWTALQNHDVIMRDQLSARKGYEVKTVGDSFFVAFAEHLDREDASARPACGDHARRALNFCLSAQHALASCPSWPKDVTNYYKEKKEKNENSETGELVVYDSFLNVRMGLHFGKAFVRQKTHNSNQWDYFGQMLNKSARVMNEAQGGQIAVSDDFIKELHELQNGEPFRGELVDPVRKDILAAEINVAGFTGYFTIDSIHKRSFKGIDNSKEIHTVTLISWHTDSLPAQ